MNYKQFGVKIGDRTIYSEFVVSNIIEMLIEEIPPILELNQFGMYSDRTEEFKQQFKAKWLGRKTNA